MSTLQEKRALKGKAAIGIRVGKVINKYKMAKHFTLTIEEKVFAYEQAATSIRQENLLDGVYVIRTSVVKETASASEVVNLYKSLAHIERAFRCMKTSDVKIRPVYYRLADRVKAHVFLCMLAYYVEWCVHQVLSPLLFEDEEKDDVQQKRTSVVAKAIRSDKAKQKDKTKMTDDWFPVQSFQTLLADLATLTRNTIQPREVTLRISDITDISTSYSPNKFSKKSV